MNEFIINESDIQYLDKSKANKMKEPPINDDVKAYISRRSSSDAPQVGSAWLITFTDIMALMLTFFVLLFSMSVPDEGLFDQTPVQTLDANRFLGHRNFAGELNRTSVANLPQQAGLNLNYLSSLISGAVAEYPSLRSVKVQKNADHIVLILPNEIRFEEGKSLLSNSANDILRDLAGVLRNIDNQIIVVGHADPKGAASPNINWDISLNRALRVIKALNDYGIKQDMIARAVSQARFDDMPASISMEERMHFARRVDLIIRPEKAR